MLLIVNHARHAVGVALVKLDYWHVVDLSSAVSVYLYLVESCEGLWLSTIQATKAGAMMALTPIHRRYPMKALKILACAAAPLFLFASTSVNASLSESELEMLFAELQAEGRAPRDTIVELVEKGNDLEVATGYTVANASSIGLAVTYAHEGVCLAPDQVAAEVVAKQAVDSSTEQARNAVQARVTETLNNFASGACDRLVDERNTESQAFAGAGADSGAGTTAGGGATPPEVDPPVDISPSQ